MSITFEFSQHPEMLEKYYKIREDCYRKDLGLQYFNGMEDEYDKEGHIIIIKNDNECVGGVRISGTHPASNQLLPMEKEGLKLTDYFPELSLDRVAYCQWGRLALLPEYRGIDTAKKICDVLLESCEALGYRYAFNVTGLNRARLYKRLHTYLGYDYHICDHLSLPAEEGFSGLEYLLSVSSIPPIWEVAPPSLSSLFTVSSPQLLQVA